MKLSSLLKNLMILLFMCISLHAMVIPVDDSDVIKNFNILVFQDKEAKLDIGDIVKKDKFVSMPNPLSLGYKKGNIWVKFTLQNVTKNSIKRVIGFSEGFFTVFNFYVFDQSNHLLYVSSNGLQIPVDERQIQDVVPACDITLNPGDIRTIYVKMKSIYSTLGAFGIYKQEDFIRHREYQNYFYFFCFGIGLSIIVYDLFFLAYLKKRIYFLYALHIASLFVPVMLYSGFALYFFVENLFRNLFITFPLIFVALIIFTQEVLKLKRLLPRVNKLINMFKVLLVFCSAWIMIDISTGFYVTNIISTLALLILILAGLLSAKVENITVKLYVFALSFFLLGMVAFSFLLLGILPYSIFTRNVPFVGFIIEMLLLSLALASKIPILENEKLLANKKLLDLQKHQNKILELKVEKQTEHVRLLLQELRHRVKNNFQSILTFLWLEKRALKNKDAIAALETAHKRIYAMSFIHEFLYHSSKKNVDLSMYIKKFIASQIEKQNNVDIQTHIERLNLSTDTVTQLGMILNELITNSYKYAFLNIENPQITIHFFKEADYYVMYYKDNGKGFDIKQLDVSVGLGYKLIHTFLFKLKDAKMELKNDNGFECIIKFRSDIEN